MRWYWYNIIFINWLKVFILCIFACISISYSYAKSPDVICDISTNISEYNPEKFNYPIQVYVYQNKIRLNQRVDYIYITDITGRIVFKGNNIDFVDKVFNSGIYIVTAIKGKDMCTVKVRMM